MANQQRRHRTHPRKIKRLADWLGLRLLERTAPQSWSEVSVVLMDDDSITRANLEFFGKGEPTDVISFRYDPVPGEGGEWSGDLLINVDRAVQEGAARGDLSAELALYIAHGFDHLGGADDDTPAKRRRMLATETAWLRQAVALDLTTELLEAGPL